MKCEKTHRKRCLRKLFDFLLRAYTHQMTDEQTNQKPLDMRVRESEARSIEAGAVRMPGGLLKADVAQALDDLRKAGYADSKVGVISKALLAARKRLKT